MPSTPSEVCLDIGALADQLILTLQGPPHTRLMLVQEAGQLQPHPRCCMPASHQLPPTRRGALGGAEVAGGSADGAAIVVPVEALVNAHGTVLVAVTVLQQWWEGPSEERGRQGGEGRGAGGGRVKGSEEEGMLELLAMNGRGEEGIGGRQGMVGLRTSSGMREMGEEELPVRSQLDDDELHADASSLLTRRRRRARPATSAHRPRVLNEHRALLLLLPD